MGPSPIRVGVVVGGARVSVSAPSGVRVWADGARGGRRLPRATLTGSTPPGAGAAFEVQVANVSSEAGAREIAERARRAAGAQATWRAAEGGWRVRVGPWASREEAEHGRSALVSAGFSDAWIAPAAADASAALLLAESGERLRRATIVPERADELLEVEGTRYRGLVELRPAPGGGVDAIDVLPLEDYLRGVVPGELSPDAFGELEALKAQAVAARTYALRHKGGFEARGYDICATPACQVYGGAAVERPLSDQAVRETAGLVATWNGQLIDALYTSTCGGHTEDVENVFSSREALPWLRGVACTPERESWVQLDAPASAAPTSPGAALIAALGIAPPAAGSAGAPADGELRDWLGRLPAALGREGCGLAPAGLRRRGALFLALADALCWQDRQRLLAPGEPEYLLPAGEPWSSEDERRSAAVLVRAGVLRPGPDGRLRPADAVTRQEAAELIGSAARAAEPARLAEETVVAGGGGRIVVRRGDGVLSIPLDPALPLVRRTGEQSALAEQLQLVPGDHVRLVVAEGRVVYLEVEPSAAGPAWDRDSRYQGWRETVTREELERRAAEAVGWQGPLLDVKTLRRGVSGRIVEAALVGPGTERVLRGLEVRRALGLRESLLVIERERDATGVARFHFTGRGWGHGVGLCQVGAWGMARAGYRFDAILRHYYTGVTIGPAP